MIETFYTTKPKLALYLMEHGFKGEPTVNIWNTYRSAWKFELSEPLADAIMLFCKQNDEKPPKQIERYIASLN